MRTATLFLLCFFTGLSTCVRAQAELPQGRTLTFGTVTDEHGNPLLGANVYVPGTSTGTSTDSAGNYQLALPPGVKSLTFSHIGYGTEEIEVAATASLELNLALKSGITLDEVMVIAYPAIYCGRMVGHVPTIVAGQPLDPVEPSRSLPDFAINMAAEQPATGASSLNLSHHTDLTTAVAYPNPFINELRLRTQLGNDDVLTVQLLNALGQVVRTWNERAIPAGEHHTVLPMPTSLPAGAYFLRLADGRGEVVTRQVIKGHAKN